MRTLDLTAVEARLTAAALDGDPAARPIALGVGVAIADLARTELPIDIELGNIAARHRHAGTRRPCGHGCAGHDHRHDEARAQAHHRIAEELYAIRAELTAGPVVLVPCGSAKLDRRAPAGELYTGALHRSARRAAARYVDELGARVLILSAAHGLVALDTELDPYDVTVGDAGAIDPEALGAQAAELGITDAVVLGSAAYVGLARAAGITVEAPLAGCPGLFAMRGRLRALAVGELDLVA